MNDVAEFARSRPNVNYRHFFKPSEELGGVKDELDFRNETTWRFQEIGRKDAKAALDRAAAKKKPQDSSSEKEHSFSDLMTAHFNTMRASLNSVISHFWN